MSALRRLRRARFVTALLIGILPLSACAARTESVPRLYAASSLVGAVEGLPDAGAPAFTPMFAATSLLVRQIREGAPPGALIAADARWADALEADGLVEPGTRVDLLGNHLVVIAAADVDRLPTSLADLARPELGRIAVAETEHVPAGRYARTALQQLGIWDAIRPRVVEATDARAAVALVARGEVDLGIVYATDAKAAGVRVAFDVPEDLHPPVVYPLLLLLDAPPAARELWPWLQGDAAAEAFEAGGFRALLR